MVHLYQIWPSNNRFFCKGRCITGPHSDFYKNVFTWGGIIILELPFICYIQPVLWIKLGPALPLSSYLLELFVILFLTLTQFSDPGIIPRREMIEKLSNEPSYQYLQKYIPTKDELESLDPNIKICTTCQIKKPKRSHHCCECDNCVEVFDHHCPFVMNCIGKRNYIYFISFIFSLSLLWVMCGTELILFLILEITNNKEVQQVLLVILLIPFGIALIFIISLFMFHLFLMIKGRTTKEQLKQLNSDDDQDSKCNITPSLFNLRSLIQIKRTDEIKNDRPIQSPRHVVPIEEQIKVLSQDE